MALIKEADSDEEKNDCAALARFARAELKRLADVSKAPAMAAYKKTTQPFFGVPTPLRAPIERAMRAIFEPGDRKASERNLLVLSTLPHRDEQYLAIASARQWPEFIVPPSPSSMSG